MNLSRLRTGRRSTCEPGRNAFTPPRMVTERPPFTRAMMVPSIELVALARGARSRPRPCILSAFSFERTTMPVVVLAALEEDVDLVAGLDA